MTLRLGSQGLYKHLLRDEEELVNSFDRIFVQSHAFKNRVSYLSLM